jgi:hypothetical protein
MMPCEGVEVQSHIFLTSDLVTSGNIHYQFSELSLMNLAVPQSSIMVAAAKRKLSILLGI